jgi:hypothetical protein
VIEFIRFNRAFQLALHLIGQGRIAQPLAPPIAGPEMDIQLSDDATRRTRETEEKGGQNPVRQRPLALVQQGMGKVVEGALAAMAPVAFAPGSVVVMAPRIDVVAVASGTLQRAIFPPQGMDVGVTLLGAEELVGIGEHWHSEESPGSEDQL